MRYTSIIATLFLSTALAAPLALDRRADAVKTVQDLQNGVGKTVSSGEGKRSDDYGYDYGYEEKPKQHGKPKHEAHKAPAQKEGHGKGGSPLGGIVPQEEEKREESPLGGILPKEDEKEEKKGGKKDEKEEESPLGGILPKEDEKEDKKGDKKDDKKDDKEESPLGGILPKEEEKRADGPLDPIAKPLAKTFGASDEELNEKRYEIIPEHEQKSKHEKEHQPEQKPEQEKEHQPEQKPEHGPEEEINMEEMPQHSEQPQEGKPEHDEEGGEKGIFGRK